MLYSEEFSTLTARGLIELVQAGGQQARAALGMLLESNESLFKAVVAHTAPQLSQDPVLLQESRIAFEAAVNSYKADGKATFSNFAWSCMRNAVRDVLRRRRRLANKETSLERLRAMSNDGSGGFDPPDPSMPFDEQIALRDAVRRLSPDDRSVIGRMYWGGQSQAAIAQIQGRSQNAVSKQHIRAIGRLREAWLQ